MSNETKIGILAVATLLLSIWGYKFLKGQNLLHPSNNVFVVYDNVYDLKVGSPVTVNGMEVGTVADMKLKPDDIKKVLVTLNLKKGFDIPKIAVAELINTSVMGGRGVRLIFDKPCTGSDCTSNGDFLQGRTLSLLGSMIEPGEVDGYVGKLQNSLSTLTDSLSNDLTNPHSNSPVAKSIRDVDIILANLKSTTALLDKVIKNSSGKMNSIFTNVEGITGNLQSSNAQIRSILSNLDATTNKIKDIDIKNVNNAVTSTNDVILSLKKTLETSEKTLTEVNGMVSKLQSSEGGGSLGMLMNDNKLYNNLERTTKNLDLFLQDIRLNPRRYTAILRRNRGEYVLPEKDPAFPQQQTLPQGVIPNNK